MKKRKVSARRPQPKVDGATFVRTAGKLTSQPAGKSASLTANKRGTFKLPAPLLHRLRVFAFHTEREQQDVVGEALRIYLDASEDE